MAREYLAKLGAAADAEGGSSGAGAADGIAERLEEDADIETQAGVREIALSCAGTKWESCTRFYRGHALAPTCVAAWSPSTSSGAQGTNRLGVQEEMQISSQAMGTKSDQGGSVSSASLLPALPRRAVAVTGSKDCSLWVWDLTSGARERWAGRRRTRADVNAVKQAFGGAVPSSSGAMADAARKGFGPAAGMSAGKQALQMGLVDFSAEIAGDRASSS